MTLASGGMLNKKHKLNVLQLSDNPDEMTHVLPCSLLFAILGHLSANILLILVLNI